LAGVTTAVATCGTAFGVDHIKVVRRVLGDSDNRNTAATGEVVFTFDPDEAGQKAASRAFAEESRFAAQTFVAVAPEGLDPCDLRLNRGDDAVRRLVSGRKPMFEFMIRRQLASHDLNTVEGRVAALRSAAPVVAGIRDQSMGVGYVRELAGWLGLDPGEVTRAVSTARHQSARSVEPQLEVRPGAGGRDGRDGRDTRDSRDPQDTALGGEADAPRERHPSVTDLPTDPSTRLERDALMALLQHPVSIGEELVVRAATAGFGNHTLSVVRDAVGANADHLKESDWVQRILDDVAESYRTIVMQLSVAPIPARPEGIADYCRGVVTSLVGRDLTRRSAETRGAMQRASADGDAVRSRELQLELVQIEQDRRRLRSE
ncbi:MAG: toprim domain-containing protein, partial [Microbacteriaceae bacterium]